MKNFTEIRDENEGAFTLVELLVVILIIGILAAIAIPAFLNQRKAAVDSSVESDVKNASTQVETWAVSNSKSTVPTVTATSTGSNGPGAMADIKVGEGTTVTITDNPSAATGDYFITATNADGNRASAGIYFDSANGGLTDTAPAAAPAAGGGGNDLTPNG